MTSKTVSITILVDNKAGKGLGFEHGLSLWIETENKRILVDTGQGPAFARNTRKLGVDLATADILVLSHGHYDHAGGIAYVVQQAPNVDIYCHPGVLQPRYAVRDGEAKAIGISEQARAVLDGWPSSRMHWVRQPLLLTEKIGITAPIPRLTSYEDAGGPFYFDPAGTCPDPIEDDLALWIETDLGVVVCLGCAHAGVVNTLDHVLSLTKKVRVRAVIGGFHLLDAGPERLEQTISALRLHNPDVLAPCHCTGERPVTQLRDALGERVSPAAAGMTYRF